MGRATIMAALGEGRFRIKIDSGEEYRATLVATVNQALALVGEMLTASYEQVLLADAQEAASRESIAAIINVLAIETEPAAIGLARTVFDTLQAQYARQVALNQPVRQQYATLKNTQADLVRQRTRWEALQTITYKDAWCVDYTTSTALGAVVATVDIPGDINLTLIAAGCRRARDGDGNISSARKAGALSSRSIDLISANASLASIDESLVTARAQETTLKAEVAAARAAYVAAPTKENGDAFEAKTLELADKRREIANLTLSRQLVLVTISRLNLEVAYWQARPAIETPDPGDGAMLERDLLSPAQTFFNAAIFPGWQKWMPTYRWGTLTGISYDNDTCDVSLFASTSTAQRLGVNQATNLQNVPIDYMGINAGIFVLDDRVVVQFRNQLWSDPVVIGFVDNPRGPEWDLSGYSATTLQDSFIFQSRKPARHLSLDSTLRAVSLEIGEGPTIPLFSAEAAQIQVKTAGGDWRTLYLDYVANKDPNTGVIGGISGGAGNAWYGNYVDDEPIIRYSMESVYTQNEVEGKFIERWEPHIPVSLQEGWFDVYFNEDVAVVPMPNPFDEFALTVSVASTASTVQVTCAISGAVEQLQSLAPVPPVVEVRIIEFGVTLFNAALAVSTDTAGPRARVKLGGISSPAVTHLNDYQLTGG